MSAVALYLAIFAMAASLVNAQVTPTGTFPATPLASKRFAYSSEIPYQVDTDQYLIRGTQTGYNICNSTTEHQSSLCQTSFFNDVSDFCLWAPSQLDKTVADFEGEMVAWCSKPGHGTRLIPEGALTGVQFLKTPDYIQVVGFMDQTKINMVSGDFGGEMDPHGADLRGNPMGGLLYSTSFTGQYDQVIEWTNFMGANAFCLKACDPSGANAANYCQHIYDRLGCPFNAPNAAQDKVFEFCDADSADFPGVYTSNGEVVTYTQPAESLGSITSMPYTARVPSSSNCKSFSSAQVYTSLPAAPSASALASTSTSFAVTSSAVPTGNGFVTSKGATQPGPAATANPTPTASETTRQASTLSNDAALGFSDQFLHLLLLVVFSLAFLSF